MHPTGPAELSAVPAPAPASLLTSASIVNHYQTRTLLCQPLLQDSASILDSRLNRKKFDVEMPNLRQLTGAERRSTVADLTVPEFQQPNFITRSWALCHKTRWEQGTRQRAKLCPCYARQLTRGEWQKGFIRMLWLNWT